jgi:hypothetical protein
LGQLKAKSNSEAVTDEVALLEFDVQQALIVSTTFGSEEGNRINLRLEQLAAHKALRADKLKTSMVFMNQALALLGFTAAKPDPSELELEQGTRVLLRIADACFETAAESTATGRGGGWVECVRAGGFGYSTLVIGLGHWPDILQETRARWGDGGKIAFDALQKINPVRHLVRGIRLITCDEH